MKGEVWTTHTTIVFIYGGLLKFRDRFTPKFGHHTIFVRRGGHLWNHQGALLIFGNNWHHQALNDFIEELNN
jgi:hypothetical protein